MTKTMTFVAALMLTMTLAACQGNKQTLGGAVGGVAGGVLGSNVGGGSGRTAAIIGGTLLGAMAGSHIGAEMDELDRRRANQTMENYRTGQTNSWNNPDSGARYEVTPTRTYDNNNGPCRDYEMDVYMDGEHEVVRGTACRNSRGEWVNQ